MKIINDKEYRCLCDIKMYDYNVLSHEDVIVSNEYLEGDVVKVDFVYFERLRDYSPAFVRLVDNRRISLELFSSCFEVGEVSE